MIETVIEPTLTVLRQRGIDYRGVLCAGLMLTPEGPKLFEYNVRFGDPELQALVPRISGGLTDLLLGSAQGRITVPPSMSTDAVVCVVLAAAGYPTAPQFGDEITGLTESAANTDVSVYSAGVPRRPEDDALVTAGGRVLNVCGRGVDLAAARTAAYAAADCVAWPGMVMRRDIGVTKP